MKIEISINIFILLVAIVLRTEILGWFEQSGRLYSQCAASNMFVYLFILSCRICLYLRSL